MSPGKRDGLRAIGRILTVMFLDQCFLLGQDITNLTNTYSIATSKACRERISKGKAKPKKWNSKFAALWGECRKLFYEAKLTNDWTDYKQK